MHVTVKLWNMYDSMVICSSYFHDMVAHITHPIACSRRALQLIHSKAILDFPDNSMKLKAFPFYTTLK